MIKYGSVCSGVEAATTAWHPLGWEPQWFSEIEKFPSAVLAHHYPDVPNLGDMTKFKEWPNDRPIDLLVGGTPCQSFSVAGLRKGLDDPRGNLMLTYLAIAERYRPRWLVWENVPGVLSSNKGRDFGTFLGALGELGYGFAYRIFDAQYFGVAQRRKRVFVVGYLGDWRRAASVLFERESLSGHPAPSRETGERVAPTVTQGAPFSRTGNERVECEAIVPVGYTSSSFGGYHQGVGTIRAAGGDLGGGSETLCVSQPIAYDTTGAQNSANQGGSVSTEVTPTLDKSKTPAVAIQMTGFDAYNNQVTGEVSKTIDTGQDYHHVPIAFGAQNSANQGGSVSTEVTPTLDKSKTPAVALPLNTQIITRGGAMGRGTGFGLGSETDPAFTLQAGHSHAVFTTTADCLTAAYARNWNGNGSANNGSLFARQGTQVRRLTPTECERLQGFPDNYTQIAWRGKILDDCPDGPRYKAMGNSMAVPVMRWIGERIQKVEDIVDA